MQLELITLEPQQLTCTTPVLFVHGAWHAAWCWQERFMPYFAERGFATYALSFRNHGNSESVGSIRWRRGAEYVQDLREAVEQIGRPPIIVAHSLGGYVAQKYLEKWEVPAMALLTPVPVGGALGGTLRTLRRHPIALLKSNLQMHLWPLVETPTLARSALFSDRMPAGESARYASMLQDESYLAFLDLVFLNLPRPKRAHKPPVLVLAGTADTLFTPREAGATARAYGGKVALFEDMAHDMMLEPGWERVADRIAGWLRSLPGIC